MSYLAPLEPLATATSTSTRRKLHREKPDKGGNVLPPPTAMYIVGKSTNGSSMLAGPSSSAARKGETLRSSNARSSSSHHHLPPRLSATLANVKERNGKDVSKRNMVVDEDGIAHDSECTLPCLLSFLSSPLK